MKSEARLRILIAKPGLDGHDRGARVVAKAYADAGFEVIYTGLRQTAEQIANAAVQESVDLVGLSCLSGGHMYLFPEVMRRLREKGADRVAVVAGGAIPDEDIPELMKVGIRKVFLSGTSLKEIIEWTKSNVKPLART